MYAYKAPLTDSLRLILALERVSTLSTSLSPWAKTPKIGCLVSLGEDKCYHTFLESVILLVYDFM